MSALNSNLLRTILSEIFFAEADREANIQYIVPKQGNWYNPQETKNGKIATWVAYSIPSRESVLKSQALTLIDSLNVETTANMVVERVTVALQFVGTKAEDLAISVMHWPRRTDVEEAFAIVGGVLADNKIRVESSWFKQEGMNTTYAYNVRFVVYCVNYEESSADALLHVNIAHGNVY